MRIEAKPYSPTLGSLQPIGDAHTNKSGDADEVKTATPRGTAKLSKKGARSLAYVRGGLGIIQNTTDLQTRSASATSLTGMERMPFLKQTGNGCGTTSAAMILSYLTGKTYTQSDIDQSIRKVDIFSSPRDLIDYARSQGVAAAGYNNSSWDEVEGLLKNGCPVQALTNAGDGLGTLHFVAITGVDRDKGLVHYRDPATGTDRTESLSDFEKKWNSPGVGFKRYINAYGPKGAKLPPNRFDGIEGTIIAADGIANITNGAAAVGKEANLGGVVQVAGGIVQGLGGAIQFGTSYIAHGIDRVLAEAGALGHFLKPIPIAVRLIGAIIGSLADGIGEAAAKFGSGIGKLFRGNVVGFAKDMGRGVAKVFGGVYDAVKGVGSAIAKGISSIGRGLKSLFSGW